MVVLSILAFVAGILLLFWGADLFVKGGEGLAIRLGLSTTTIGLTVIAFGTSLPELFVSTEGILLGNFEIALGNIVGSNIANIGLILALCAFFQPNIFRSLHPHGNLMKNAVWMLLATILFVISVFRGILDVFSGIVFLLAFGLILRRFLQEEPPPSYVKPLSSRTVYLYTAGGLGTVILGADLLLRGSVDIATILQIPPMVVGLSMVAVGTSLPEFATSLVSIYRGNPGISVGNLIGSNIFNLLFILGIGSMLKQIPVQLDISVLALILFSVGVFPLLIYSRNYARWAGLVLLLGYAGYIATIYGIV
jgi:cation:H+ antiporter